MNDDFKKLVLEVSALLSSDFDRTLFQKGNPKEEEIIKILEKECSSYSPFGAQLRFYLKEIKNLSKVV